MVKFFVEKLQISYKDINLLASIHIKYRSFITFFQGVFGSSIKLNYYSKIFAVLIIL